MRTFEEYLNELKEYSKKNNLSNTTTENNNINPIPIQQPLQDLSSLGTLMVSVTHSRGTYPIKNAHITVFDNSNPNIYEGYTDENGKTARIHLAAPSSNKSEKPNISVSPSKLYNIRISANGFLPAEIYNIPVFGGVTSIQQYDMLFAAAATNNEIQKIILPIKNNL